MSLWVWVAVAAVGAAGSVGRYLVDAAIGAGSFRVFPLGTLVVNLSGSFVFGLVTGLALYHAFPATPRLLLGAGACGAYTTFSTFALETSLVAREQERTAALLNLAANVLGGCLAGALGLALAAL